VSVSADTLEARLCKNAAPPLLNDTRRTIQRHRVRQPERCNLLDTEMSERCNAGPKFADQKSGPEILVMVETLRTAP
jgi:hypothetical protein